MPSASTLKRPLITRSVLRPLLADKYREVVVNILKADPQLSPAEISHDPLPNALGAIRESRHRQVLADCEDDAPEVGE